MKRKKLSQSDLKNPTIIAELFLARIVETYDTPEVAKAVQAVCTSKNLRTPEKMSVYKDVTPLQGASCVNIMYHFSHLLPGTDATLLTPLIAAIKAAESLVMA